VLAKLDDEQLTRLCAALGDLIDASHRVDEHAPVGV
jgi:hypothetical protein